MNKHFPTISSLQNYNNLWRNTISDILDNKKYETRLLTKEQQNIS